MPWLDLCLKSSLVGRGLWKWECVECNENVENYNIIELNNSVHNHIKNTKHENVRFFRIKNDIDQRIQENDLLGELFKSKHYWSLDKEVTNIITNAYKKIFPDIYLQLEKITEIDTFQSHISKYFTMKESGKITKCNHEKTALIANYGYIFMKCFDCNHIIKKVDFKKLNQDNPLKIAF